MPFIRTIGLLALATVLCVPVQSQGQDRLEGPSRQVDEQGSPVRKAKLFPKLGDAYLELVSQKVKSGDYEQALIILEAYVEAVNKVHTTLRAAVPDPEKKSDGFRQLEAHLRGSIRILNNVVLAMPTDQSDPFIAGMKGLQDIDSELINELFPRRPDQTTSHSS